MADTPIPHPLSVLKQIELDQVDEEATVCTSVIVLMAMRESVGRRIQNDLACLGKINAAITEHLDDRHPSGGGQ